MKRTLHDVSIILVTYKGDELTKSCLQSLKQTCGQDPQIVVVDNSPSETTRHIVASYPNAVYVRSPGNPGFAGGNNRALPFCDRDYILLLNNDTIVHSRESIEQLVAFLEDNPKCGAVQGSGRLRPSGKIAGCGSWLTPYGFMWTPGFNEDDNPLYNEPHPCFMGGGFFLMFRRQDLQRVGGFLFRSSFWCYYEESEFCHRIWLSGMEVWYQPTVPIDHLCSQTAGKFKHSEIMRRYIRNMLFSLRANLSFASRLRILPFVYTMLAGHAIFHLLRGNVETFKSDFGALIASHRDAKRILAAQRQANRIRKASDSEIFKLIMKRPSIVQFLRYIRANM